MKPAARGGQKSVSARSTSPTENKMHFTQTHLTERRNHRTHDALEAVSGFIGRNGTAPSLFDEDAAPLTAREVYALNLVVELISALRERAPVLTSDTMPPRFAFGDVVVDTRRREVRVHREVVHLTPKEYEVLLVLAREPGVPVSREFLRTNVWMNRIAADSRAIDQLILELRRKLESNPRKPRYIKNARSFGYRLECTWTDDSQQ